MKIYFGLCLMGQNRLGMVVNLS